MRRRGEGYGEDAGHVAHDLSDLLLDGDVGVDAVFQISEPRNDIKSIFL